MQWNFPHGWGNMAPCPVPPPVLAPLLGRRSTSQTCCAWDRPLAASLGGGVHRRCRCVKWCEKGTAGGHGIWHGKMGLFENAGRNQMKPWMVWGSSFWRWSWPNIGLSSMMFVAVFSKSFWGTAFGRDVAEVLDMWQTKFLQISEVTHQL